MGFEIGYLSEIGRYYRFESVNSNVKRAERLRCFQLTVKHIFCLSLSMQLHIQSAFIISSSKEVKIEFAIMVF